MLVINRVFIVMNNVCVNHIYFFVIVHITLVHLVLQTDAADTHERHLQMMRPFRNFLYNSSGGVQIVGPFTCNVNVSISHCQFRVDHKEIYDLSRGNETERITNYFYHGGGLEKGECGVQFRGHLFSKPGGHVIECRVRNETDCKWKYASAAIFSTYSKELPAHANTSEHVVYPGNTTSLIFKTQPEVALSECFFKIYNWEKWMVLSDNNSRDTDSNFQYFGQGLKHGECGVTIHNVTDDLSGLVWFKFKGEPQNNVSEGMGYINLIVAKVPDMPVIEVNRTKDDKGRDILHASCSVIGGRPAPNIQIHFGKLIVQDMKPNTLTCVRDDDWTWPKGNQTTKLILERKLGATRTVWEDKLVWCSVKKEYIPTTLESKKYKISDIDMSGKNDNKEKDNVDTTNTLLIIVIVLLFVIIIGGALVILFIGCLRGTCCFSRRLIVQEPVNCRQEPSPVTSSVRDALRLGQRRCVPIPHRTTECSIDDMYVESTNEYEEIDQSFEFRRSKHISGQPEVETPEKGYLDCMKFNSIYQEHE